MAKQVDMGTHVLILGWFNVVAGGLFACLGLLALFFLAGVGLASGESEAIRILTVTGCAALALFLVLAAPGLAAGYGLLNRLPWGRVAGIIVGILSLFNIPIGTAFGIYALWVLSDPQAAALFEPRAAPSGDGVDPGA